MTDRPRRFSPGAIDATLAIALFALGLVSRIEISDLPAEQIFSRQADGWNMALIAFQALPIAFRRRWPVVVLAVVSTSFVIDRILDYPNTLAAAGIVLAVHAIGTELPADRSSRIGFPYVVFVTVFTAAGALTLESVGFGDVIATSLFAGAPLYLGREVHERRRRFEQLQARADQAERDQEMKAAEAVAEERARIARELHDVVAHQMTVMTLQAEGASRIAKDIDPRVTEALQTIKGAGHSALTEMRRMVGLLRTDGVPSEMTPLPGFGEVPDLVDRMQAAGLEVGLRIEGSAPAVAESVGLAVYRIVQESLTNVARHAGPKAAAEVSLFHGDHALELAITDNGRGAGTTQTGDGHGIIGMRERIAVLNGTFGAGPQPGGGYRVHATIPYQT